MKENTTKENRRSYIRQSTQSDLKTIHKWLSDEKAQGVPENFLCNWSIIEESHEDHDLLVYIDGITDQPVAFQLGKLLTPGILQVRSSYRGTGIGQRMVDYCIDLAAKRDECLLYIQCKPSSSIPFWKHMGFKLIESSNYDNYAYRTIEKPLQLPEQGEAIEVVIRFFPHSIKWVPETEPFLTYTPQAIIGLDDIVYLAQRILFHSRAFPEERDVVVEIEVDGNCRYLDKAKYINAEKVGVTKCLNGFYIDKIRNLER